MGIHSLRVTFGSMLAAAGVPLTTAQHLMRHSDPKLTASVYTDPAVLDLRGAVSKLPTLAGVQEAARKAEEAEKARAEAVNETGQHAPKHALDSGKACTKESKHDITGGLNRDGMTRADDCGIVNVDGAMQRVASRDSGKRNGSGAGTRTPDTWIMIPLL